MRKTFLTPSTLPLCSPCKVAGSPGCWILPFFHLRLLSPPPCFCATITSHSFIYPHVDCSTFLSSSLTDFLPSPPSAPPPPPPPHCLFPSYFYFLFSCHPCRWSLICLSFHSANSILMPTPGPPVPGDLGHIVCDPDEVIAKGELIKVGAYVHGRATVLCDGASCEWLHHVNGCIM